MAVNIDNYFLKDSLNLQIKTLNYEKLFSISDEEFSEFYLSLMDTYKNHFEEKDVKCHECREEVLGSQELVRYFGSNVHSYCLKETMENDIHLDNKNYKKFFQRVVETHPFVFPEKAL